MSPRRANPFGTPYFVESTQLWRTAITLPPGPNGKRRRKFVSARTKEEARKKALVLQKQLEAGLVINKQMKTVKQFLDWWQASVLPSTVSEGTIETYEGVLRLWVVPYVGHIKLIDLTPANVTEMLAALQAQGLSANSRSLARRTLARALKRAEQEGWVVRNAARLADGPRGGTHEQRHLTIDEAEALLVAIKGDRLEGPITVQLALGLRRGEVLGLTWSMVDLDGEYPQLHVRKQLQRRKGQGLVLDSLKTKKSQRTLALPLPLAELIRDEKKRQRRDRLRVGGAWDDGWDLVFATPIGTPIDPDNYRHGVSTLAKKAEIGHIGTHTLRHSSGSFLYALGVPTKTIAEILGHSSTRVTEDVYVHVQQQARREAAQIMQGVLWK